MFGRRDFLVATGASLAGLVLGCRDDVRLDAPLRSIEARIGGRLGVHALDTASGRRVGYRDAEPFAMASTFKLALAAAVLARVDEGKLRLDEPVAYGDADMVPHAPITSTHLQRGFMSIEELCRAAVTQSDNVAANLLLRRIDGPAGLTSFARQLGDEVTRLDRFEPDLNANAPGDLRDTTSARAMVSLMHEVFVGDALHLASRARLIDWCVAAETGLKRLRAGLPKHWRAGDKTGTGGRGAVNDIAIAWPPKRSPVLVAVYMSGSEQPIEHLSAAHRDVARLIATVIEG